jgi:hypothetical protein
MTTITAEQDDLADLVARLLVVYAGALPAGMLRAVIDRADRMVPAQPSVSREARMSTVEAVARRMLTDRLARMIVEKPR